MPGIMPITFCSGPSFVDLRELLAEVVERELALAEPLLLPRISSWSNSCWAFSTSVSMSPRPRMRPAMRSGWNSSSASRCSPVPMNLIGTPVTCLTRERRAAAGVAVELGHDDAVELQRLVERLGAVDGVLAGHAVDDQVHLLRRDLAVDPLELVHQLVVDVQPAGRVEDHDVGAVLLGFAHGRAGRRRRDPCCVRSE